MVPAKPFPCGRATSFNVRLVAGHAASHCATFRALASMSAATLAYKGLAGRLDGWRARLVEPSDRTEAG
jgi:hypothetical protein